MRLLVFVSFLQSLSIFNKNMQDNQLQIKLMNPREKYCGAEIHLMTSESFPVEAQFFLGEVEPFLELL